MDNNAETFIIQYYVDATSEWTKYKRYALLYSPKQARVILAAMKSHLPTTTMRAIDIYTSEIIAQ